ncbi:kinase-like domain-containing protein [Lasiosphaeria ovina]|uniref:EKC/KEOPS complex subunit BUD32 n=1 Tax=Lasiosphaeria ovina TaxID=92902 RepID=A0AAE0NKI5_9PEZI|nr:kinase-like domain-containing protein [Lasiosphaeria ovina]
MAEPPRAGTEGVGVIKVPSWNIIFRMVVSSESTYDNNGETAANFLKNIYQKSKESGVKSVVKREKGDNGRNRFYIAGFLGLDTAPKFPGRLLSFGRSNDSDSYHHDIELPEEFKLIECYLFLDPSNSKKPAESFVHRPEEESAGLARGVQQIIPRPAKGIRIQVASMVFNLQWNDKALDPRARQLEADGWNRRPRGFPTPVNSHIRVPILSELDNLYNEDDLLGHGAYNDIFKIHDKIKKEAYAAKVTCKASARAEASTNGNWKSEQRDCFAMEWRCRKLKHENIVHVVTAIKDRKTNELQILVLRLYRENLRTLLIPHHTPHEKGTSYSMRGDNKGCIEPKVAEPGFLKSLAVGLFGGLEYLRRHRIIHNDLRPENVLVEYNYRLLPVVGNDRNEPREVYNFVIADFGIAQELVRSQDGTALGDDFCPYIRAPAVWTSPEVSMDGLVYSQSDMWSMGHLLIDAMGFVCSAEPAVMGHDAWCAKLRFLGIKDAETKFTEEDDAMPDYKNAWGQLATERNQMVRYCRRLDWLARKNKGFPMICKYLLCLDRKRRKTPAKCLELLEQDPENLLLRVGT